MKWYDQLYLGKGIRNPEKLKWKISHNAGTIRIYVIALAVNERNLLEVIPSWELMQKGYPWKKDLHIIGLAKGYDEALGLVEEIVAETYRHTGGVDVRGWLRHKQEKVT